MAAGYDLEGTLPPIVDALRHDARQRERTDEGRVRLGGAPMRPPPAAAECDGPPNGTISTRRSVRRDAMIRPLLRRLRQASKGSELAWRYTFNLAPTLAYGLGRHPLSGEAARVLEDLNRDGIAITSAPPSSARPRAIAS